jgi:hypothetical protein
MQEEYCRLLDVSRNTYYVHKRENRPIVALLEKYFTKEDLEEFLETGKISRLENNITYTNDLDVMKSLNIDNAIFSAKAKLQNLENTAINWAYNKGALSILKDVLASMESNTFTIENAKDILIERIKGYEAKWYSLEKRPTGQKLLNIYIQKYFSKLECYAICIYSDEVFNYKGFL